jgi:hypothetical protein
MQALRDAVEEKQTGLQGSFGTVQEAALEQRCHTLLLEADRRAVYALRSM